MIHVIGQCEKRVFGLLPAERLSRQARKLDAGLVASASCVLDDIALQWLVEHPGIVLATEAGQPLAIVIEGDPSAAITAIATGETDLPVTTPLAIGPTYIRKLRRRD